MTSLQQFLTDNIEILLCTEQIRSKFRYNIWNFTESDLLTINFFKDFCVIKDFIAQSFAVKESHVSNVRRMMPQIFSQIMWCLILFLYSTFKWILCQRCVKMEEKKNVDFSFDKFNYICRIFWCLNIKKLHTYI